MKNITQSQYHELVNTVGSQINAGRYKQACENAEKWVAVAPKSPDAKYWLAWSYSKLKKHPLALKVVKSAIDEGVKHPAFDILLAKCYLENGNTRAALVTARAVNYSNFNHIKELNTLGALYSYLGEFNDALKVFEKIIVLDPKSAFAHYQKGMSENFCHQVANAEKSFLKVLELDPKFFRAYYMLSYLKRQTLEQNNMKLWELTLENNKAVEDANIFLNLALFKEYEDIENYQKAFSHLTAANSIISKSSDYDQDSEFELTKQIIQVYSEEFINSNISGYDSSEPIFIIGMPRTGTTLVEKILSTDKNIYSAGELNNFNIEFSKLADNLNSRGNLIEALSKARLIDYRLLGKSYIESTRPNTGRTAFFIDKMPFNYRLVGAILLALPRAKVIYLSRHPMDTCFSNYKQLFQGGIHTASYTFEGIANQFVMFDKLMKHWQNLFGDRILKISYENLVLNQEKESKKLVQYCSLKWNNGFLSFHKNVQASSTASVAQIRQPIYNSSLEKWKCYEEQLIPLKEILNSKNIATDKQWS